MERTIRVLMTENHNFSVGDTIKGQYIEAILPPASDGDGYRLMYRGRVVGHVDDISVIARLYEASGGEVAAVLGIPTPWCPRVLQFGGGSVSAPQRGYQQVA
jgi:hypothetical protein